MTELPYPLATQTWVPSESMASGPLNPYLGPFITMTNAPVDAKSSVTESPLALATQTCVPSDAIATGVWIPSARGDVLGPTCVAARDAEATLGWSVAAPAAENDPPSAARRIAPVAARARRYG